MTTNHLLAAALAGATATAKPRAKAKRARRAPPSHAPLLHHNDRLAELGAAIDHLNRAQPGQRRNRRRKLAIALRRARGQS